MDRDRFAVPRSEWAVQRPVFAAPSAALTSTSRTAAADAGRRRQTAAPSVAVERSWPVAEQAAAATRAGRAPSAAAPPSAGRRRRLKVAGPGARVSEWRTLGFHDAGGRMLDTFPFHPLARAYRASDGLLS